MSVYQSPTFGAVSRHKISIRFDIIKNIECLDCAPSPSPPCSLLGWTSEPAGPAPWANIYDMSYFVFWTFEQTFMICQISYFEDLNFHKQSSPHWHHPERHYVSDKVQFEYSNIESYLVWKDFVLMAVSEKLLTFICCLLVLTNYSLTWCSPPSWCLVQPCLPRTVAGWPSCNHLHTWHSFYSHDLLSNPGW